MPRDDAGAQTADRYEWQAAMAAGDGLGLYLDAIRDQGQLVDDGTARLICEHHEDWCRVQADAAELVSAKHRDPSVGVFTTLRQLVTDGGLGHLIDRWRTLEERPRCRLVTTAGLAAGPCAELAQATEALRNAREAGEALDAVPDLDGVVVAIAQLLQPTASEDARRRAVPALTVAQLAETRRFLSLLTLATGHIGRMHVGYAAPAMFVAPVLAATGRTHVPAAAAWEAVLALFRSRMRAGAPIPRGALPDLIRLPPTATSSTQQMDRYLAARVVTLSDIDVALTAAVRRPDAFLPLKPLLRTSKCAIKMSVGQCSANSIERAEMLRIDYQRYWRARVSADASARAQQDRLRRSLLSASDRATSRVSNNVGSWGAELWRELEAEAQSMNRPHRPGDMDEDLVLGGMCDLANRCRIWFSEAFDVNAELARRRVERES
jgi:hypothetical protein